MPLNGLAASCFALLVIALIGACANTPPRPSSSLKRPLGLALICIDNGTIKPLSACDGSTTTGPNLFGYISNAALGDVAILNLTNGANVDTNLFVPGFTRVSLGRLPSSIQAGPDNLYVYTINPADRSMSRVNVQNYAVTQQTLPGQPLGLLIPPAARNPDGLAYVASPSTQQVLVLRLSEFGTIAPIAITAINVPGSPRAMVINSDHTKLYVAHHKHNYVTVIDLATKTELTKIGIGPECADGIDNDGDGKIDDKDDGCTGPTDTSENKPETGPYCNDGIDNDGDGLIDAQDPDCQDPSKWPACADGKDNDGDGKTDYSKDPTKGDPGCTSPFDDTELSNNPRCSDGIDNDGDGLIDYPNDPDCLSPQDDTEGTIITQCNDGIDNDGDGLIDFPNDPKCLSPEHNSESPPPTNTCNDGIDNDGDGLIDADDPDCANGTEEKLRQCSDGVDNDGNGLVDWPFDGGCRDKLDNVEVSECSDGIDNDGDGLIDGDDPDCFGPSDNSESDGLPQALSQLAIDPEGKFIYVLHRGYRTITVIDLSTDKRVDVNAPDMPGANAILRYQDVPEIKLARNPQDIAFVVADADLYAIVSTTTGEVVYIEARKGADWLHRLKDGSDDDVSTMLKPTLTLNGEPVDIGFTLDPKYATPGPLEVVVLDSETNKRQFYGVIFDENTQLQQTQSWTVSYEGVIPKTDGTGRFLDHKGTFHAPIHDFCTLGVQPGDYLVLKYDTVQSCGQFIGKRFQYTIEGVLGDRLLLKAESGIALTDEGDLPSTTVNVPFPTSACPLPQSVPFEVRVAKAFAIVGSQVGFLHQQRNVNGRCEQVETPDPLFTGRAQLAEYTGAQPFAECPIPTDSPGLTLHTFKNPLFSLNLYPGCAPVDEGQTLFTATTVPRNLTWSYTMTGAQVTKALVVGSLPGQLVSDPGAGKIYIVDPAGDQILRLNVIDDSLIIFR